MTHFQSLLGTNLPQYSPERTPLRRTIKHILDYSIKPAWAKIPLDHTGGILLRLDSKLHPERLTTPVVYHSHFSATGWGSQALSTGEIGIVFGLPSWARHDELNLEQTFPFVPIQGMDGCLKAILESTTATSPLQTPSPQAPATALDRTWLPAIRKFLPHSWIDAGLVTTKAVKSDVAGVPTHLWDKRCALVLPHVTPALNRLRQLLHWLACTRLLAEFQAYGPDCQTLCSEA
jgi:hypothetical protein